jgi:hypothetical protein
MMILEISESFVQIKNLPSVNSTKIENESFRIIDQALKDVPDQNFFNYIGDFDNPFQTNTQSANQNSRSPGIMKAAPERIQLKLKGILSNEQPLAILEDNDGKTFIRGVGDSVGNQKISSISTSRVTILDGKKRYEITVKEE